MARKIVAVLPPGPGATDEVVGRLMCEDRGRIYTEHVLAGARSCLPPRVPAECWPSIVGGFDHHHFSWSA